MNARPVDQHHGTAPLQEELREGHMVVPGSLDPDQDLGLLGGVLAHERQEPFEAGPADREAPLPDDAFHQGVVDGDLVRPLACIHPDRNPSQGCPSRPTELTSDGGTSARSHAR